jgi:hypothetical protein
LKGDKSDSPPYMIREIHSSSFSAPSFSLFSLIGLGVFFSSSNHNVLAVAGAYAHPSLHPLSFSHSRRPPPPSSRLGLAPSLRWV